MKIMKCDYCGKDVKVAPSREGYKTHFCCAEHHHKFMKKEKLTLVCDYCKKEFNLSLGEYNKKLKRNKGHIYCSRECFNKGRKEQRKVIEHKDYISIFYKEFEILLDKDDAKKIDTNLIYAYKKPTDNTAYAFINGYRTLHRYLTNCPENMVVDHINHNGLDNRRSNLRVCKYQDNARNQIVGKRNTSGYIGISWCNKMKKWKVTIQIKRKSLHGGYFSDIEEAKQARKDLEQKYWR